MSYTIEQIMEQMYKEYGLYDFQKLTLEQLRGETFQDISRVHDWRGYILGISRYRNNKKGIEHWKSLSDLQKVIQYCVAVKQAENEEWD